jgi:hypothetical protein
LKPLDVALLDGDGLRRQGEAVPGDHWPRMMRSRT